MNVSKILSPYRSEFVYLAVMILLVILSIEYWILSIVLVLYLLYLFKYHLHLLKIGVILILVFSLRIMGSKTQALEEDKVYEIKIISIEEYDQFTTFIGVINYHKYYFQYSSNAPFMIGEIYQMRISPIIDQRGDIPYSFNREHYDKAMRIHGRYKVNDYQVIKQGWHVNQMLEMIDTYIRENMPNSLPYVKTMVLADNADIEEETLQAINHAGISHLFAVSGLHIGLLVFMMKKGLTMIWKHPHSSDAILIAFLGFYMIITAFSPSVVRASLMVVFVMVNHYGKWKLDIIDMLSLIFIALLLVHPFYYLQLGFQLSFLMTFFILLGKPLLHSDDKILSALKVSCFAFFASLPIVVSLNQSINLLTIFYNVFFVFFVMFAMLPLAYITFIFPIIDPLYGLVIALFERLILMLSKFDYFTIDFTMNHVVYSLLYYGLFVGLLIQLERKQVRQSYLFVIGLFGLIMLFQGKFIPYDSVHFIDVYGDATLVQSSFDRCNILIDTGVGDPYDELITYLKNKHVKRIDYFIVSHGHADHAGETMDILGNFDVIHYIDKDNVQSYQDVTVCGQSQFFFYPMDRTHPNENDNSLIMSLYLNDDHYLFTGDIESNVEEEFIRKYVVEEVDKLKVPHHGSITSSTEEMIDKMKPKEAFVIVALRNTHDHPSSVVIQRYIDRGVDVYRTDQLGTIEIRYLFGKEWKKSSK